MSLRAWLQARQYNVYIERMVLGHDRPFQMRVSGELLRKLDAWRRVQPDLPSRAEAIRRMVQRAIALPKAGEGPQKR